MNTEHDARTIILHGLARFTYLTNSQIRFFSGRFHAQYLHRVLRSLRDQKLVYAHTFLNPPRLESFFSLTPKGVREVHDRFPKSINEFRLFPGKPLFRNDYHHRKLLLDYQVALYLHLQNTQSRLIRFDRYFDKTRHAESHQRRFAATAHAHPITGRIVSDALVEIEHTEK